MERKNKLFCPHCGSTDIIKSGKSEIGTQKYYCNSCHKKSSGNRTRFMFNNKENIHCPICGGTNLKPRGFNKSGTQRFLCLDCNKKVTPNPIDKSLTLKEKQFIIMYHFNLGVSVTNISKYLHRGFDRVNDYVKEYERKVIKC